MGETHQLSGKPIVSQKRESFDSDQDFESRIVNHGWNWVFGACFEVL